MRALRNAIAILLFFIPTGRVWSAACCGGGVALPSLISSDHQTQISTTLGQSQVVIESVDNEGYWIRSDRETILRSIRLDVSTLVSDRSQVGLTVPLLQRQTDIGNQTGLGDVAISAGYEFLTDWDYHYIRPKGISYLQLTLPTGLSRYESQLGGLDSRGQGFWALGAGLLFTKTIDDVDVFFLGELHRSFGHEVLLPTLQGSLSPGWGGVAGAGVGYNFQSFRLGGGIQWFWESQVLLGSRILGESERFATGSIQMSYLTNDEWAWTAVYTDQTWFGSPQNTSLARGLSLQIQRRWMR